jgi:hypothetical protein
MMNHPTLMSMEEPYDEDLSFLMKEVAKEAKEKAAKAKNKFDEQLLVEVNATKNLNNEKNKDS